jgi:hypothetical protein
MNARRLCLPLLFSLLITGCATERKTVILAPIGTDERPLEPPPTTPWSG